MKNIKLFALLMMLVAYGCKKEKSQNVASLSDFPLANGDVWNYQVYDSSSNTTQQATFKIVSLNVSNGITYYGTQTIINGNIVDSGQIIGSGDSVMFQPNGQSLFSNITLLFPLTQNSRWHTEYSGDSVFVSATNLNLSVLSNNYDSVYNVNRIQSIPDLYVAQSLYIAPHVGIIQETLDVASLTPEHKTVRLVSYVLH